MAKLKELRLPNFEKRFPRAKEEYAVRIDNLLREESDHVSFWNAQMKSVSKSLKELVNDPRQIIDPNSKLYKSIGSLISLRDNYLKKEKKFYEVLMDSWVTGYQVYFIITPIKFGDLEKQVRSEIERFKKDNDIEQIAGKRRQYSGNILGDWFYNRCNLLYNLSKSIGGCEFSIGSYKGHNKGDRKLVCFQLKLHGMDSTLYEELINQLRDSQPEYFGKSNLTIVTFDFSRNWRASEEMHNFRKIPGIEGKPIEEDLDFKYTTTQAVRMIKENKVVQRRIETEGLKITTASIANHYIPWSERKSHVYFQKVPVPGNKYKKIILNLKGIRDATDYYARIYSPRASKQSP